MDWIDISDTSGLPKSPAEKVTSLYNKNSSYGLRSKNILVDIGGAYFVCDLIYEYDENNKLVDSFFEHCEGRLGLTEVLKYMPIEP